MSWSPTHCIYHGNCDDGFGAAWAIRRRWPDCTFLPGFYGKPLPETPWGANVLFVDFSAKRAAIDALAQKAASIVILDHHKTAEAELAPFACKTSDGRLTGIVDDLPGMFRDAAELDRPLVFSFFDMDRSGAAMAWEFAHGDAPAPTLIELIEDRDLWRFAHAERTKRVSAALRTYPHDFEIWTELMGAVDRLDQEGVIVLRAHRANLVKFLEQTSMMEIAGHIVPAVNVPYHYASDIADALLNRHPQAPFAAAWFRRADGKLQFSLRSTDERVDVSAIAVTFGGGGHRNAAGFETDAWLS